MSLSVNDMLSYRHSKDVTSYDVVLRILEANYKDVELGGNLNGVLEALC